VHVAYGKTDGATDAADVKYLNFGFSFDAGVIKVNAGRSRKRRTAPALKMQAIEPGIAVPVGAGTIKASYARHDLKDSDNDFNKIAVGYHHNLSKRTTVYTTYARVSNKGAVLQPASWPTTACRARWLRPALVLPVAMPAASSSASATRSDRTTGQPVFIEEPPLGAVFSLRAAIQREAADAGADAAGSVKGPFWPQAARAATADIATRTLAITTLDCIIASILRTMTADTPARSLTDAQYQALTRELLDRHRVADRPLAAGRRDRHRRTSRTGGLLELSFSA
jgi:hypothetical protein